MSVPITYRLLESVADLDRCLDLQTQIWGDDPMGCVPPLMLKVMGEVGGIVAGAFAEEDELVGMVCGLSGIRQGRLAHWSHMLGVKAGYRDRGLGARLKWLQRDLVLAQGVETLYWTFDPLESRNAHLNFNRLGTRCEEYRRDFYLGLSRSRRFTDIGTDRMVVAWPLRQAAKPSQDDRAREDQSREIESRRRFATAPVVNVQREESGRVRPTEPAVDHAQERVRIEIPDRIQALKIRSPQAGALWRSSTRSAFELYLGRGYEVEGFYRDGGERRCFYCLARRQR